MMHIRSTRDVSLDERNTTHTLQTTNVVLLVSLHLVKIILFLYLIRNLWWLEINFLGIKLWYLCLVNFQFSIRKELPNSSMDNFFCFNAFSIMENIYVISVLCSIIAYFIQYFPYFLKCTHCIDMKYYTYIVRIIEFPYNSGAMWIA